MSDPSPSAPAASVPEKRPWVRGSTAAATAVFLTVQQFAEAIQVDRNTVYKMIAAGTLPHLRAGRLVRIPRSALDTLATSFGGGRS